MDRTKTVKNRENTYDIITIILHWTVAIMTVNQFVLAFFPTMFRGTVAVHETVGLTLASVVVLRLVWRLTLGRKTSNSDGDPLILRIGAKLTHVALYGLLLIIPMLGWAYSDAMMNTVHFYGLPVPVLVDYDRAFASQLFWWKTTLSYGLLALLLGHAGMAIVYHHFFRRDQVLRSMLPPLPAGAVKALDQPEPENAILQTNR